MSVASLEQVTAQALTPDQLLPYVAAVSGLTPRLFGNCVGHLGPDTLVLVGYPLHAPQDLDAMNRAVAEALALGRSQFVVLGPARPLVAPDTASCTRDAYALLPVPPDGLGQGADFGRALPQKLRHMLHRARSLSLSTASGPGVWTADHRALAETFMARRALADGTCHIFRRIDAYLSTTPQALLFSAHDPVGRLVGCAVGDFSPLSTALYMFAFRAPDAPPGVADRLLAALVDEAAARGHSRVNLGLGLHSGIRFFKDKWQGVDWLPFAETRWPARVSLLTRLRRVLKVG